MTSRIAALSLVLALFTAACEEDTSSQRSAGNGGSGGTAGSGGSGGAGDLFPAEEEACDETGTIECPGDPTSTPATYSLRCVSGAWRLHETCGTGTYCNPHEGLDHGRCQAPFEACNGAKAGALVCKGLTIYSCGPEPLASARVETCPKGCLNGACSCGAQGTLCTPDAGGEGVCTKAGICQPLSGG